MLFALCAVVSVLVSGSRPATDQGAAPLLIQAAGYLCATAGALLLLISGRSPDDRPRGAGLLGALIVLVVVDAVALTDGEDGANIGHGFVRLIALVVMLGTAVRIAGTLTAPERRP